MKGNAGGSDFLSTILARRDLLKYIQSLWRKLEADKLIL